MAAPFLAPLGLGLGAAGLGGLGSAFASKSKTKQLPLYTGQQQNALNQLLQTGFSNASAPADFGPIEQRARSQFNTQTIPSLAERFTAMGGGQRSSAFQNAIGSAGAGLEEGLAALRSQYGLQQQQLGLQQLGLGLRPQFENIFQPAQQNALQGAALGLGSAFGPSLSYGLRESLYPGSGLGYGGMNNQQFSQLLAALSGRA